MKKLNLLLLLAILIVAFSCKEDDDDNDVITNKSNLSGKWEFILSPDKTSPDTTNSHGYTGSDFGEWAAISDEVYLYEDSEGNIEGFSGPIKLKGQKTSKQVALDVYVNPDGEYNPTLPIEKMILMSKVNLTIEDYSFMEGTGSYEPYSDYPNIVNNTYFVNARMLSTIRDNSIQKSEMEVSHWYDFICNEIDKLVGWIANHYSDGKVRPMDGCSLHKNGGGYYVLGHEGPGRDYDIFSTTIYYPYEWCRCASRSYSFYIEQKGEHMSIDKLKEKVESSSIKDLAKKLGFELPDDLTFGLQLFYNEFGGFAITMGYSTNTHNLSLYVTHDNGSSSDVKNHILITTIRDALKKIDDVHDVTVYAGHTIHDYWHLKRSFHFNCNSPLVFTYIMGTHNVNFD
jgi:hypothetical protein